MHDDSGEMTAIRRLLRWYPRDAWLWMMASQWHLIGNAAPLVGRTAEAGDQRGSALIAVQIVRLMMELAFLQERTYWPYPKWFGTAFSRLETARTLGPDLDAVIGATAFADRERALLNVLKGLAERHNALDLTPPVDPVVKNFEVGVNDAVRPYRVLNSGDYVSACRNAIADDTLRELVTVGAIDQLTHADGALVNFSAWPETLREAYRSLLPP